MSLSLRAGGLRAGLPEREYGYGSIVASNTNGSSVTRGRCRFPSTAVSPRASASAPPRLLSASYSGLSKRHRRVVSESPRPEGRRLDALGSPITFNKSRFAFPPTGRNRGSCAMGKVSAQRRDARRVSGMPGRPGVFSGIATKEGHSVPLAVNSLLSPASVSTSEESGLIAARHNRGVETHVPASQFELSVDEERPSLNAQRLKQEALTGTVRVRLSVRYPSAAKGVQLKAVGNRRALGSWNPGMAADFENRGDGTWSLDVTVPPGLLRFKLVVQSAEGGVIAEKGIRRTEVPSARLAQAMPSCYFNISCVWGVGGDPAVQAIRLPETARQHQIRSAEEQVTRLRERQAKLQARMMDLSSQIKRTNNQISTIHKGVQSVAAQEASQRRGTPSTSSSSQPPSTQPASQQPPPTQQPQRSGLVLGLISKLRRSRPKPNGPVAWVPPQDIDSLFDHPSWSGGPKALPAVAVAEETVEESVGPIEHESMPECSNEIVYSAEEIEHPLEDCGEEKETEEGLVLEKEKSEPVTTGKALFRSAECPAVLMTAGAMWSARAAASVWHSVRAAIPEHHRQAADVCGAVAAAAVFVTLIS